MGVNDWGQPADGLDEPELSAWAESVAAVVNNSDVPVDSRIAAKVSKAGDTMTGALTLPGNPASALQAAPKQYVDAVGTRLDAVDAAKVAKAGDTMTGALVLPGDPSSALQAAPKQYVDAVESRVDAVEMEKVSKAGDTMTGGLTIDNTAQNGPTAKVVLTADDYAAAGGSLRIVNYNGTALANVDCAVPTTAENAANKGYVDASAGVGEVFDQQTHSGSNTYVLATLTIPAAPKPRVAFGSFNGEMGQGDNDSGSRWDAVLRPVVGSGVSPLMNGTVLGSRNDGQISFESSSTMTALIPANVVGAFELVAIRAYGGSTSYKTVWNCQVAVGAA